jgi:ABC-type uncharacterized transport system permease subunit
MARTLDPASAAGHRARLVADLDHGLATAAAVLGIAGLLCAAVSASMAAVVLGLSGVVVGLCAQMISRTRAERFVDMIALLACFLAFAVGASQGGLP